MDLKRKSRSKKRRKKFKLFNRGYDHKHDKIYIIIASVCAFLLAVLVIGGTILDKSDIISFDSDHESAWGSEYYGIDPEVDKQLDGYKNYVVYGVDQKGKSDIIIIASENKETHEITLTSINRDSYLECKPGKYHKANRGFAWGGIDQGLWEINHCLDLNCRDAIALDWTAVEKLVDTVGGVEVVISNSTTLSYVNGVLDAEHQIDGTGKHTLDGVQAVAYCRTRKDADSFVRGERNIDVFSNIFEKAREMPKKKVLKVYKKLRYDISSNINDNVVREHLYKLSENKIVQKNSWPEAYKTMWAGYYYYVPRTLEEEVIALHEQLFNQEDYQPSETVKKVNETIEKHMKDGTLSEEP